ncbi:hypothetical protein PVAP13_7KG273355 [Panicum virgatum]|uniref:Uncharacterized protein n=1 Tax=Panicum virgatum TaxID=38727 RepID=A0A8T0QLP5_PANVG|nr:hypothetical protein PVAP13_7KG273355 [Panicum virgatum]
MHAHGTSPIYSLCRCVQQIHPSLTHVSPSLPLSWTKGHEAAAASHSLSVGRLLSSPLIFFLLLRTKQAGGSPLHYFPFSTRAACHNGQWDRAQELRRGDNASLGKEPNGDCDADACKEPSSKLLLSRSRDGAARHRTHTGDEDRADPQKHDLATATAIPSPPPPARHGLREGQRRRACALELERSGGVAAPVTPPSPAPSSSALPWRRRWRTPVRREDGGAGQIRRPRARPMAAAAGSGGLDIRLRRWRRPPPPFLADGHGVEQIPGKRRGGAAAAAPPGVAAEQERWWPVWRRSTC